MIQQNPTCTISTAASAFSVRVGLYTCKHSSSDRRAFGAVHVLASAERILIYTPELAVGLLPTVFWAHREFVGIILISTMWLVFPFYYADCEKKNSISGQKKKAAFNIVLETKNNKKEG